MEIIKLRWGEMAPDDADCIKIDEAPGGRFTLVASALMVCGDGEDAESIALVASEPYTSYDDAEAAGLAWAEAHCVETIYIETGSGPEPMKTKEGHA